MRFDVKQACMSINTIEGAIVSAVDLPVLDAGAAWLEVEYMTGSGKFAVVALYGDGTVGVSRLPGYPDTMFETFDQRALDEIKRLGSLVDD